MSLVSHCFPNVLQLLCASSVRQTPVLMLHKGKKPSCGQREKEREVKRRRGGGIMADCANKQSLQASFVLRGLLSLPSPPSKLWPSTSASSALLLTGLWVPLIHRSTCRYFSPYQFPLSSSLHLHWIHLSQNMTDYFLPVCLCLSLSLFSSIAPCSLCPIHSLTIHKPYLMLARACCL